MNKQIKSGPHRRMSMHKDPEMKECVPYSGTQRHLKEKDEKGKRPKLCLQKQAGTKG